MSIDIDLDAKKNPEAIRSLDHDFRGLESWGDWDLGLAYMGISNKLKITGF